MKITNKTRNTVIATHVDVADTASSRLVGLLNHTSLSAQHGLLITQCRSIHMFFMKFAIDAIFVNRDKKVVGLVRRIRPFWMSPYFWRASEVIELPEGTIDSSQTKIGDILEW